MEHDQLDEVRPLEDNLQHDDNENQQINNATHLNKLANINHEMYNNNLPKVDMNLEENLRWEPILH